MTNEEKLYQIFPDGICPFSKVWLSEEYREPTTKDNLGVDAVSRKDVHDMLENLPVIVEDKWFNWLQKACMRLAELPSVTPQEPRCKDCKWWKDSDGKYRRGCGAESQCPINTHAVYYGEGYCYMFSPKAESEPQESEDT